MRVLWSVNVMPQELMQLVGKKTHTYSGGWLEALQNELTATSGIELTIAVLDSTKAPVFVKGERCTYVLIPSKSRYTFEAAQQQHWSAVLEEIMPDVVHIHGTELPHGLCLYRAAAPNYKVVVSLQGLVSEVSNCYLNGLTKWDLIRHTTLRELLLGTSVSKILAMYQTLAAYETELLLNAQNVIGRTDWDKHCLQKFNSNAHYYFCNESMRSAFYKTFWTAEESVKNTIFFSQSVYPLKGLHRLLDALFLIKQQIPDVKVIVSGENIVYCRAKKQTAYGLYLKRKIRKLGFTQNIVFAGVLSQQEYAKQLAKSNLFVLASSVENSSNSLCEAMLVGTPCIASSTGGTPSLVQDGVDGLLFDLDNAKELSNKTIAVLSNKELAQSLSNNAKLSAARRHNAKQNAKEMMRIYNEIARK